MNTWLDILVAIVLLGGLIDGMRKGLVNQAVSIAAFVIGLRIASSHYEAVSDMLSPYLPLHPMLIGLISFAAVFAAVVLGCKFVAGMWQSLTENTPLSFIDSVGGAALGLLKSALFCSVVILLMEMAPVESISKPAKNSMFIGIIKPYVATVWGSVPKLWSNSVNIDPV